MWSGPLARPPVFDASGALSDCLSVPGVKQCGALESRRYGGGGVAFPLFLTAVPFPVEIGTGNRCGTL